MKITIWSALDHCFWLLGKSAFHQIGKTIVPHIYTQQQIILNCSPEGSTHLKLPLQQQKSKFELKRNIVFQSWKKFQKFYFKVQLQGTQ